MAKNIICFEAMIYGIGYGVFHYSKHTQRQSSCVAILTDDTGSVVFMQQWCDIYATVHG